MVLITPMALIGSAPYRGTSPIREKLLDECSWSAAHYKDGSARCSNRFDLPGLRFV
jgi:hypothetical protein